MNFFEFHVQVNVGMGRHENGGIIEGRIRGLVVGGSFITRLTGRDSELSCNSYCSAFGQGQKKPTLMTISGLVTWSAQERQRQRYVQVPKPEARRNSQMVNSAAHCLYETMG